jgi:hypothetical protein
MRIENKKYVLYIKQEFGTFADGMVYWNIKICTSTEWYNFSVTYSLCNVCAQIYFVR